MQITAIAGVAAAGAMTLAACVVDEDPTGKAGTTERVGALYTGVADPNHIRPPDPPSVVNPARELEAVRDSTTRNGICSEKSRSRGPGTRGSSEKTLR